MADAPVGGRDSETETAKPARIPVSEPPEVDPEGTEPAAAGSAGEESAQETSADETAALDETTALARPSAGEDEAADVQEDEESAEPAADAAQTQVVPKPAFDAFAAKSGSAAAAPAASPAPAKPEPAAPPAAAPIPVSEAPDLEAEAAAAEAEQPPAAAPSAAPRVPAAEVRGPDSAAEETVVVPAEAVYDQAADPGRAEEAAAEPALLAPEADETTLIPKVAEHITESTTAMPSVGSSQSDMARRPYTAAPAGYGSARQAWGGDGQDGADAQATRVQPAVPPGPPAGAAKPGGRGYQPPEFHAVDPQRSQLPPPQNFKLDRRELDADGEGSGKHVGRRALLVGGGVAVAAVAGLTAAGVIKLPGTAAKVPTVGFAPATNSGASSATQTGTAFLTAWQNGEFEVAANITDNPTAALAALKEYKTTLGVVGMVVNPNAANAVGWMTYAVTTQAGTPMGQWQYSSGFATYYQQIDGDVRWFVKWEPSILYTSLKAGYQLKITKTPATVTGLVDRNNQPIEASAHPSLAVFINVLMSKAKATGATDGQNIIMTDAKGNQLATVATLTPPIDNGTVATTLDMKVQSAAESAVTFHGNSSIVAIQPSTGHILAIANNTTSQYYDDALLTHVAPGSTFKIITSTALLSKGLTSLDSNVACPQAITIDNQVLKNSEGEAGDYSYEQDFAASCNNAFSSFWDVSGMTGNLLADTAKTYYGLNQQWDIGTGSSGSYMTVPGGLSRGELAESLVGQGNVLATTLSMCSVAATVANGSFMQPIVLPKYKQITATPLGSKLQGELKTLMASVVATGGTAAGIFPDNGQFFAKTGTAEYGPTGNPKNNSWFVIFDNKNDIALCALAIDGNYGAQTAAPECHTVLKGLGYV